MNRGKLFFIAMALFWTNGLSAAVQEAPITEEELQNRYNKAGVVSHIYPRQLIDLRESFIQKVKIWEKINKRSMHPVDLFFPHLELNLEGMYVFKRFNTEFLIGTEEEKRESSPGRKKLSRSVVLASETWQAAAELFLKRKKKWFIWEREERFYITLNNYDYLFSYQINIECALMGCTISRSKISHYLKDIITWDRFGKIELPTEKKLLLRLMRHQKSRSFPPYIYKKQDLFFNNLTEEEFDIVMGKVEREPLDLPLYGLREEPPLEPRSMWERIRGIKKPIPECLRDPSVMEGERPYLDMIPPKGFSVFAHAFPEFRDEILGFEAYGMDRGPVIYRGLMDPPPYPVEMITDGEGEEHSSGAAAAASSVSATGPAAAAAASSADVDLPAAAEVDPETVMLLRKRR